ncbi:hypothetical protein A5647_21550 [Mycobacterium sp. 1100029.7]|nr:hypothetical protein A5647_21550 [Mycobacterium sp. 1100029.7]
MTSTTTYVTVSRHGSDEVITLPADQLAERLIAANRDASAETIEAMKGLEDAIVTGQPIHEFVGCLGIDVRVNMEDAIDIGPAPARPAWCLPDAEPTWEKLAKEYGKHPVCSWSRDVNGDYSGVWIRGDDQIIDQRIMRGAPRVMMSEPPARGWTAAEARQHAAALLNAADILDEAAAG